MAEHWPHVLVIAGVTFLVRALPFLIIRRPMKSLFLRSFLTYVPFVTLAAMAFPDMLLATESLSGGLAGFLAALLVAWAGGGLVRVAGAASLAVLLVEWLLV